jgi:hypothetical protein
MVEATNHDGALKITLELQNEGIFFQLQSIQQC